MTTSRVWPLYGMTPYRYHRETSGRFSWLPTTRQYQGRSPGTEGSSEGGSLVFRFTIEHWPEDSLGESKRNVSEVCLANNFWKYWIWIWFLIFINNIFIFFFFSLILARPTPTRPPPGERKIFQFLLDCTYHWAGLLKSLKFLKKVMVLKKNVKE